MRAFSEKLLILHQDTPFCIVMQNLFPLLSQHALWCIQHVHAKIRMFISYESDSNRFLSCYKSELSGLFHTFMRKFRWTCERNWYFFGFSLPSFLQSPISSSFQLWFAHWLKYRIFDFSSFETIYSMPKNDLGKYSKFYLKFIVYVIAKFWFLIRMFEL